MILRDSYDIPEEVSRGPHSPAMEKFLRSWFGDIRALSLGELDITFLNDLTEEELKVAREMLRRNLKLRQIHLFIGVSALHDVEAAPTLRAMIDDEPSDSRRLSMAGALWKLTRDPIFPFLLERAKASGDQNLITAHLNQVVWLDDDRALDFLIDLLADEYKEPAFWRAVRKVAYKMPFRPFLARTYIAHRRAKVRKDSVFALALLNRLESGWLNPAPKTGRPPSEYRELRNDPAFRRNMVAAIHKWNAESTNGR